MVKLSLEYRRKLLWYLYATVFVTSTTYGTVTFLLPVYAEGLGASYFQLGLMGAVGSIVYTVMTLLTGVLLDRYERVRLYLGFTIVGVGMIFSLSLADSVPEVIVMRGALGIVSGTFWVTASTVIADLSPPKELTQSVGRYNVAWIAGFVVGPFVGGFVSDAYGFLVLFMVLSAFNLLSVLIQFVKLTPLKLKNATRTAWGRFSAIRSILNAYITLIPYAIILGIYMAILPGHMGAIGLSASAIGLLLTMTNGVRGVGFLNSERWVRWGPQRSLWLAGISMSVALFLVAFSGETLEFVLPLAVYGFAGGIITPVILDYIAHRTPKKALGTAMGLHECVYGVGMSVGPFVGGAIAEAFRPSILYVLLAALATFILPLSLSLKDRSQGSEIPK
ncbi:MAG: MFS transporter [Candidatus Bathyarchaeota archaeon]|jgi:MFS family permease